MHARALGKYSFGIGDRFAQQAPAQLAAIQMAKERGISLTPVWNKSFREHAIAKTRPIETRIAADAAVKQLGWSDDYFVDADHVTMQNADGFIDCSDYFTLDVAEYIGITAAVDAIDAFVERCGGYVGSLVFPGSDRTHSVSEKTLRRIAGQYLMAVMQAGELYRHICKTRGGSGFIVEVSMDESALPQTPLELFFILAAMAGEKIPIQAIAPKFSGRFNKGIDYVGDVDRFQREFEESLAVIRFAVDEFDLPGDLKISVHTGSDKFTVYPVMGKAIRKYDTGIHIKTAGTTWLEELIGLAQANDEGLELAREIYELSLSRLDALIVDYTAVIDIDPAALPPVSVVRRWDGARFAESFRHDQSCPNYNPHVRQLLHVGFKIAAEMGERFLEAVRRNEHVISENVTDNIFTRHILRLFPD